MKTNGKDIEFQRLLMRVRQYDAIAQREMYDLLVLRMFNTVLRILKNREDAQDCLQIGFSLMFNKIDQYDVNKGAFTTWMTKIFINESLRILKRKRIYFEEINDNYTVVSNATSALEEMRVEDIMKLINSLPDQMRIIFNLYEIEGYSHREIGQMLEIAESSSRTFLMRAKKKLRLLLETTTKENISVQPNMES